VVLEEAGHEITAETDDGARLLSLAGEIDYDLIVSELTLPHLDAVEVAERIASGDSLRRPMMVLSSSGSEDFVLRALAAGIQAYVLKTATARDFLEAIRRVMHGDRYLSPDVATPLVIRSLSTGRVPDPLGLLTRREREVLRLVAEGCTNKDVANALGVAVKTVEAHRANLMRKLDLHDLSALIRFALRVGVLSPQFIEPSQASPHA